MDIRSLPVYAINLAERRDRWKRFTNSAAIHEFKNVRKVAAVNGRTLDGSQESKVSIHTRYNILRNYRRSHYEIATMGAIGASMSHIQCWKEFVASGEPLCIIMEDDAMWTPELVERANTLYASLPATWGIWTIGYHPSSIIFEPLHDEFGWNRLHNFTGAHSYMLTKEAAKTLLAEPYPIETHIEFYMTAVSALNDFSIIQHPTINVRCGFVEKGVIISNSNTAHRNRYGCPTCNVQDDLSQLFSRVSRKTTRGVRVSKALYERAVTGGGRKTRRRRRRV